MFGFLRRMSGRVANVPAGLMDAGMAALAHFLVGLTAVNLLSDVDLGVYAVFFAAFMVAAIVPQFLIFTPAEVIAVSYPLEKRLGQLVQSLRLGFGPTLAGVSFMVIAAAATARVTTPNVTIALAVTTGSAVMVSPAQDHLRRMLHIAGRSRSAMFVSIAQFLVVFAGVGIMIVTDVPPEWIPFGSLTIANIVSMSLGMLLASWGSRIKMEAPLLFRELVRSGRWLLAMALVPFGALFVGALIIVHLAGSAAMGYAEAARIAAQPILVLGTGLNAVLGPRGIEAAIRSDRSRATAVLRTFLGLIVGVGVLYLVLVGYPWVGNPMVYLVPVAYEVNGLVAVTIVSHIITAAAMQYMSELMGGRKEVELTRVALLASPFLLLGSATAAITGAFARSIGMIMESSVRYGAYSVVRDRMYREDREVDRFEA